MTIVATPGAVNANSYADEAYAESFFMSRLGSDAWLKAASETREAALIQATVMLDSMFEWNGERTTEEQSLRWPRAWCEDRDGYVIDDDIVPDLVKQAQCELAKFLIANSGYSGESRDVDRLTIGTIRLDFDDSASALPIPTVVVELLRGYGIYRGSGKSGSISTPMYRV